MRYIKILLLFCVLGVYLLTLPSDIGLGDSGTLAAAAVSWGIPHPPGFPSYVLIAHWFSYLPWGSLAQKLAMVSVLASVATVGLVMEMAGIIPALILAFSYGFWSQAVNVETYALTNLVIVLVSYLSSRAERSEVEGSLEPRRSLHSRVRSVGMTEGGGDRIRSGVLLIMGIVLGMGLGLNPVVVGVIPSLIFVIARSIRRSNPETPLNSPLVRGKGGDGLPRREYTPRNDIVAGMTCFIITAIAIYSYLPMRAGQHPFLNWSDPSTVERFIKHVTGGGLSVVSSTAVNGFTGSFYWLINSFSRFIYVSFVETLGIGMILAVIGGYFMFKRDRNNFWYWTILVLSNVILAGVYVSGNRDSWYVTSLIGVCMLMGITPRPPLNLRGGDRIRSGVILISWSLPLVLLSFWGPRMWERARSNYVGIYINDLYKDLPEKAILIGGGETFNSLTLYAHEAIKLRTDVTPVDMGTFYGQKWYRENGGNRGDWGDKGVEMAKFTDEGEFSRILEQFVEANSDRPVFITGFLLRRPIYGGSLRPAYVPEKYKLEPWGIVYRLSLRGVFDEAIQEYPFGIPPYKGGRVDTGSPSEYARDDNVKKYPFYLESNYLKAVEDIQLDYGLALEMRGDFFGAAAVAPKYFDQNRLNTKIKELNSVK